MVTLGFVIPQPRHVLVNYRVALGCFQRFCLFFPRSSSCNFYLAWLHCSCSRAHRLTQMPSKLLIKPRKLPNDSLFISCIVKSRQNMLVFNMLGENISLYFQTRRTLFYFQVRIEASVDQRGVPRLQVSEVPHPDSLPLQEVRGRRGAEQDGGVPAVRVASLVRNLLNSFWALLTDKTW